MNITETKGMILQSFDGRITKVERCGCPSGNIREEKIHNLTDNLDYLRKTTNAINDKLFWGLLLLIVIAFMAGVNITTGIMQQVLK